MTRRLIQSAKQLIPKIVDELSKMEGSILILQETPNGCALSKITEIKAWIDETGAVICPDKFIFFGSHPLKKKEVTRIIEDEEYFEFLKD